MTARIIDVRPLHCTQAVMALLRALVAMSEGEEMEVLWKEASARRDMLAILKRRGHIVVREEEGDDGNVLVVRK